MDEEGKAESWRHPITYVDWYDSLKWCNAKSECRDKDETGSACRIRGGSWKQLNGHSTVSYRVSRSPDSRYTVIGFRIARSL